MSLIEREPRTPYGEMEFWLSPTEKVRVRAKGPFFITEITLVYWSRELCKNNDALVITSERDQKPLRELEVRIGQIAQTRRLRWPGLLWFKDPSLLFEIVPHPGATPSRLLLRIHHEEALP